jgi:hypothetical protein
MSPCAKIVPQANIPHIKAQYQSQRAKIVHPEAPPLLVVSAKTNVENAKLAR